MITLFGRELGIEEKEREGDGDGKEWEKGGHGERVSREEGYLTRPGSVAWAVEATEPALGCWAMCPHPLTWPGTTWCSQGQHSRARGKGPLMPPNCVGLRSPRASSDLKAPEGGQVTPPETKCLSEPRCCICVMNQFDCIKPVASVSMRRWLPTAKATFDMLYEMLCKL